MVTELAQESWRLPPLDPSECGPLADFPRLSDAEKHAVWDAYAEGNPTRVPVTLGLNNRVFVLEQAYNVEGLTYESIFSDAEAMLIAQLRANYLVRCRHHLFCDLPTELPESWEVSPYFQNVYESAAFGAPISCGANDVPAATPNLDDDNKHSVFDVDIDHPLELGVYKTGIEMTHAMRKIADSLTFFGRPIEVRPYAELVSDGPLTNALNLRGAGIFRDLKRDPEYAHQLFDFIVEAGIKRVRAFLEHWDLPEPDQVWFADDAVANIGTEQYREFVLPYHRKWYNALDPRRDRIRGMHLCGDATRHFKLIRDELGISAFDTGYPVDFGALRRELGPRVEIAGGVEVPLLMGATPGEVYDRTTAILSSGVCEGDRFILREGNNLPPGVPWANLAAMYKAAFDFGAAG